MCESVTTVECVCEGGGHTYNILYEYRHPDSNLFEELATVKPIYSGTSLK